MMFSSEESVFKRKSGVTDFGKAVFRFHSVVATLPFEGICAGLGDLVNRLNRSFEDCSRE